MSNEDVVGTILHKLAKGIDLSKNEYERAESAYRAMADHLGNGASEYLSGSEIRPQGSFAIGTVVKPIANGDGEFDVDLICRLSPAAERLLPSQAKAVIGDRLKESARYNQQLKEKARCWRIDYKGDFHLDVAPIVRRSGQDRIPDRELKDWIITSPEEYASWFNRLADQAKTEMLVENRLLSEADVKPLPNNGTKGWLRRAVQLLKRHRDIWAESQTHLKEFAPISIIISTLAARALEQEVLNGPRLRSDTETLVRILTAIPSLVERPSEENGNIWIVASPVAEENFANRWNENGNWARAFFSWHQDLANALQSAQASEGLDELRPKLSEAFGNSAVEDALQWYGEEHLAARKAGRLKHNATSGAVVLGGIASSSGAQIRDHTFYGKG